MYVVLCCVVCVCVCCLFLFILFFCVLWVVVIIIIIIIIIYISSKFTIYDLYIAKEADIKPTSNFTFNLPTVTRLFLLINLRARVKLYYCILATR